MMADGPSHLVHVLWVGFQQVLNKARFILVPEKADISNNLHFYTITDMPLTNRLTSKSCNSKGAAVQVPWSTGNIKSSERGLGAWYIQLGTQHVYQSDAFLCGSQEHNGISKCKKACQQWCQLVSSQVSRILHPRPRVLQQ